MRYGKMWSFALWRHHASNSSNVALSQHLLSLSVSEDIEFIAQLLLLLRYCANAGTD